MFEPNYQFGKPVRWRIYQEGGVPFGIAGIYWRWKNPDGRLYYTFAMLTVNADSHLFYRQFQKPGDEKRMPIFLNGEEYVPWLTAAMVDAPRFFKQHPGPFLGEPAPMVRVPKVVGNPSAKDAAKSTKVPKLLQPKVSPTPPDPPAQGDLF